MPEPSSSSNTSLFFDLSLYIQINILIGVVGNAATWHTSL